MGKRLLITLFVFISVFTAQAQGIFTAKDSTTNSIFLQWNKQIGSVTSYQVRFRNIGTSDSFSVLTTIANLNDTTFLHTGLLEGRGYEYKLFTGSGSPTVFTELLGASGYTRPERPSALGVIQSTTTHVRLTWTDNSVAETGFWVEASTNGSSLFKRVGNVIAANANATTITGLAVDSTYQFRIRSFVVNTNKTPSDTIFSAYSVVSDSITLSDDISTPTGLVGRQPFGKVVLEYTWNDVTRNESGFELQLSKDNGATWFYRMYYPANTVSSSEISGLEPTKSYIGRVRSFIVNTANSPADTVYSSFSATTTPLFLFPQLEGPKNLVVNHTSRFDELEILWDDPDTFENQYEIQFSLDQGRTWKIFADLPPNNTPRGRYIAKGIIGNIDYFFRMVSINAAGPSPFSNAFFIVTRPEPPRAPSELTAVEVQMNVVILSWKDNSNNEDRFVIERSLDNGVTWVASKTVDANVTSTFDSGLKDGTSYLYRVIAQNISGRATSNVITIETRKLVAPNRPENLEVVVLSDKEVRLTWVNSKNEDFTFNTNTRKRNIVRLFALNRLQNEIEINRDSSSVILTNLLPKVDYGFIVFAANDAGESGSGFVYATLFGPPSAPTNLVTSETFNNLGDRYFNLGWRDNSNDEEGFIIRAGNTPSTLTEIAKVATDRTNFFHFPFDEGVSWYYTIKAFNKYGESAETNMVRMDVSYTKAPNAPYHFRGEFIQASKSVRLSWLDNSIRESSFDIYRSSNNGASFERIASLPRNTLGYLDVNVSLGVTYQYRIQAVNPFGGSDFASTISVLIASAQAQVSPEFIRVFPNPTADVLFFDNQTGVDLTGAQIDVVNEVGRVVLLKEWNSDTNKMNLQSLKPGTYTIRIKTDKGVIAKKVYKY
ncbi:MAG: fibronectin type III domain-containing protein [Spirosomataceae bacterium]